MGTRNLVSVYVDGVPVVAQYGQWDGYPGGQGRVVLDFCRKYLKTPEGREAFKTKLRQCRWLREGEAAEFLQKIGVGEGAFMSMAQAGQYDDQFPYQSRDIGAKILGMVRDAPGEVVLQNSTSFAGESLFCEYAYVVDITEAKLEAYVGFQKSPPPEGERFANAPRDGDYYPVRLARSWDLGKLPTFPSFKKAIEKFRG